LASPPELPNRLKEVKLLINSYSNQKQLQFPLLEDLIPLKPTSDESEFSEREIMDHIVDHVDIFLKPISCFKCNELNLESILSSSFYRLRQVDDQVQDFMEFGLTDSQFQEIFKKTNYPRFSLIPEITILIQNYQVPNVDSIRGDVFGNQLLFFCPAILMNGLKKS
jgi:hypothetical protein